jgi:hypothetical protein
VGQGETRDVCVFGVAACMWKLRACARTMSNWPGASRVNVHVMDCEKVSFTTKVAASTVHTTPLLIKRQ